MKPQFLGVMLLISFFCGNLKEIYSLRMAILPQKITDHLGNTVNLDSQTPLDQLVKRLDSDWQFKLIDQAPQIGYPDLMYSIGVYRGRALPLLVHFARTNPSRHAKYGAVLSIHLIGIELKSNHEGGEKFINPQARKALIDLLSEQELQIQILQLLIRDPWPLDIPYLLRYLETDTPHAWGFVKALQAHNLHQRPVHQELPAPLAALECSPCKDLFPNEKDDYHTYRLLECCVLDLPPTRSRVKKSEKRKRTKRKGFFRCKSHWSRPPQLSSNTPKPFETCLRTGVSSITFKIM